MPTVAYRVIRSRRAFVNAPVVRRVLAAAIDDVVKPHFISEFDKRVANWKHKPEFKARKFITTDALRLDVYPSGPNKEIYGYVTKGTRPHIITAKRAPALSFMWGGPGSYQAKTTPGGGYGGPGTVTGGKRVAFKSVHHPGFKGRNFEALIRKENAAWFKQTMENAWRRAIRAMNS